MNKLHDRSSGSHGTASRASTKPGRPESAAARPGPVEELDILSDVLRSVRLTGSMFFLVEARAPWSTRAPRANTFAPAVLPASHRLVSYHVVTRGSCWAGVEGTAPVRLEAGDVLVVPHGDAYFLADPDPATTEARDVDSVAFFREMAAGRLPAVVTAGGNGPGTTHFICGFLGCDSQAFDPVLGALPSMIHMRRADRASDRMSHLIELALCELRERRQGGRGVLLRLSELMFIEVVRCFVESAGGPQTGWMAGLRDPVAGRALARLHSAPSKPWTLQALARAAGVSRSVLAQRFGRVVGQPPIRYLAQWRMHLAAQMLAEPSTRVKKVAAAVGYESEAAFSRAFRKHVGVAPLAWRERSVDTTQGNRQ
ncbi:MAG TPA: AraC family transcriptional regulator [Zeimonas sp.]|nr:AraC family transcriptional regulator [Zeimonas sp.]